MIFVPVASEFLIHLRKRPGAKEGAEKIVMAGPGFMDAGNEGVDGPQRRGWPDLLIRDRFSRADRRGRHSRVFQRAHDSGSNRDDAAPAIPGGMDQISRRRRNPIGFIERQESVESGVPG